MNGRYVVLKALIHAKRRYLNLYEHNAGAVPFSISLCLHMMAVLPLCGDTLFGLIVRLAKYKKPTPKFFKKNLGSDRKHQMLAIGGKLLLSR